MLLKGHLPWRLGATSYVMPGDILDNVRNLAPVVDDVQLLFFESRRNERLPQVLACSELDSLAKAHALTYTVHLPTDIRLGAAEPEVRQQGIDEIFYRMEILAGLQPLSFDLHLCQEKLSREHWLANLDLSLTALAARLGESRKLVAIENIDYSLALILPLVQAHGFSICLDFGHLKRYGHDQALAYTCLPEAGHLHLHGVSSGRDHLALTEETDPEVGKLTKRLVDARFQGVVTLELYDQDLLTASLAFLGKAWADFIG